MSRLINDRIIGLRVGPFLVDGKGNEVAGSNLGSTGSLFKSQSASGFMSMSRAWSCMGVAIRNPKVFHPSCYHCEPVVIHRPDVRSPGPLRSCRKPEDGVLSSLNLLRCPEKFHDGKRFRFLFLFGNNSFL